MPEAALQLIGAALVGYLIGAIPVGVLVGRLRGVDPRDSGSGRTGTTNAIRSLGIGPAAAVAIGDIAKGIVAVLVGTAIGPAPWGAAAAAVASVIGHVRSVFIGFGGGRGVATGAGAMVMLAPIAVLVALFELVAIIWATRLVSLASLSAATTVAIMTVALYVLGHVGPEAVVAGVLIGIIVIVAHLDNIGRLLAGTERRLGK